MNWRASPEYANSKEFFDLAYRREVQSTGRHTDRMCEVKVISDRHRFAPAQTGHIYWAEKGTLDPIVYDA